MQMNGVWVGWGLGDWSHYPDGTDKDNTVRRFRAYARAMFRSYAGHLADNNKFDEELDAMVREMQRRYLEAGKLVVGLYIPGVLDLPTQEVCGFRKKGTKILPLIFTVEGHMSNMFFGPVASNAETLQNQGVCYWKPIWYANGDLPFNNKSGINELLNQVGSLRIAGPEINGVQVWWDFGPTVPWGIEGFSQGAMIVSEFMEQHVLPENGRLHWRLATFKRGLALGNPRREYGVCAPWADNPPESNTQGIMGDLKGKGTFVTTGTALQGRWAENANDDDMFAENTRDSKGMDKTAIAKIITENSWFGGEAALMARLLALLGNPVGEGLAAALALISAIRFLAANPNPHYTTVAEPGDIEWMRGVGQ